MLFRIEHLRNPKLLPRRAYSLIELSIVLLIIGIIIGGATQSTRLIRQFKLSTARSLTKSSPVASIADLSMWIDTTAIDSFSEAEAEDGTETGAGVTNWYDINPSSSVKHNVAGSGSSRPYYTSGCVNGLPCLRFDGTDDFMTFDGNFLTGTDYTIFVVEQRRTPSFSFFIGYTTIPTVNNGLLLGWEDSGVIYYTQGGDMYLDPVYFISTTSYSSPKPNLHTFINSVLAHGGTSSSATFNYYSNSSSSPVAKSEVRGADSALGTLASYNNAAIGRVGPQSSAADLYYKGDICEMIFYNRALKIEERTSVESYLLKKWGILKSP